MINHRHIEEKERDTFRERFEKASILEQADLLTEDIEIAKLAGIFNDFDIIKIIKTKAQTDFYSSQFLKSFLRKNLHYLTPYQTVYLLADAFKNESISKLIKFLDGNDWWKWDCDSHVSLFSIVQNDKLAANFLLNSSLLSAAISSEDFKKLSEKYQRNIPLAVVNEIDVLRDLAFIKEDLEELIKYLSDNLFNDSMHVLFSADQKDDGSSYHPSRLQELNNYLNEVLAQLDKLDVQQAKKLLLELNDILNTYFKAEAFPSHFGKSVQSYYLLALSDLSRMANYVKGVNPHGETYETCKKTFFRLKKVFNENVITNEKNVIPKEIHYHWYGKALPADYVKHMKLAQSFAPDFKIKVFTNNPKHIFDNVQTDVAGFPDFFNSSFEVHTLSDLLEKAKPFFSPAAFHWVQRIVNEEKIGLFNYAVLSDFTRLLSLLVYGGVYLDTDLVPTERFELPNDPEGFFRADRNNCILIASPQHPDIFRIISRFIDNYIRMARDKMNSLDHLSYMSLDDDYHQGRLDPFYKKHLPLPTLLDCRRSPFRMHPKAFQCDSRRQLTIQTTGPALYHSAATIPESKQIVPTRINKKLAGQAFERSQFGGIFTFCDNTWVTDSQHFSVTNELKSKQPGIGTRRLSI